jgi:hypothetical protein
MRKNVSFMPTGETLKYTSNAINSHTRISVIMVWI